jgi:magnesium-transporting ATPase (P-type)
MDDRFAPQPIARWYVLGAVASLLFMLLGCALFAMHIYTDPSTLPLDQRAMFEAEPKWVTAAMGLASLVGVIGAVMLLLRLKAAVPLMLISLVLTLIWFAGLFAAPGLRDVLSTNDIAVSVVVVALSWTIFWFARHSRQRGWLR